MSTATKGRRFEHEIPELFRQAGFSVIRGAGSKAEMLREKVDLVATKATKANQFKVLLTVVGAQCKVKKACGDRNCIPQREVYTRWQSQARQV